MVGFRALWGLWSLCWLRLTQACAPEAWVADGISCGLFATGLNKARGMVVLPSGVVLVVEAGASRISALWDENQDGVADGRQVIAEAPNLFHGIAVNQGFLYASSDTTVYRWKLAADGLNATEREVAVFNMNADGQGGAPRGHKTRTLIFDEQDRLYISIGSEGNVDPDSYRSRIRRFSLQDPLPAGGLDFAAGEVFADGLRNEVGLAFADGVLWGVENSADNLHREDLGGDIHNDNPGEELNRLDEPGGHYGYPWCWTEFELAAGLGPGTIWAWPGAGHDDAWCRSNTIAPALVLPAHSAPLGITFYTKEASQDGCSDALPQSWHGDAFIGYHGSWNRDVPTGYKVVRVPFIAGEPAEPEDLLRHDGDDAKWPTGVRPVDVVFDLCGRLFVSSDGPDGEIFLLSSTNSTEVAPDNPTDDTYPETSPNDTEVADTDATPETPPNDTEVATQTTTTDTEAAPTVVGAAHKATSARSVFLSALAAAVFQV